MRVDAGTLVPHRPPMLLIDALVECGGGSARAEAALPEGHLAVADGAVLESALVECVAQTAAAMKGFDARGQEGPASIGMLAGAADFEVFRRPPAGRRLTIEVREERRLGALALIYGRVLCDGQTVASGQLRVHDPGAARS